MAPNLPTLSVMIPNYNHADYLPRCLEAILGQSVLPLEIIVLDDASTDESIPVIERFARAHPLIRLYKNETNQGVVAGMNRGLDLARGEYIYYAAADDQILPGFFEQSLRLLSAHPGAALSCAICEWREIESGLNRHMGVGMGSQARFFSPPEMVELEKRGKLLISPHTAVMRRAAFVEAGKFIPALRWHCDWFAIYVAGFRHGICFVPEPLAIFNIYGSSFSLRGSREQAHREVMRELLERLSLPEYADVMPLIRDSGALFLFGKPLFKLVLRERRYRSFLTAAYLRKTVWQIIRMELKKVTPRFAADWYFRLCGYKATTSGQ